jgi:hypothetical protein
MRFRRPPVFGTRDRNFRAGVTAALCITILAAGAVTTPDTVPFLEPVQHSIWESRIKRLKLADPESTEVMLAGAATQSIAADNAYARIEGLCQDASIRG